MAIVTLTPMLSEASGKVAGLTFVNNTDSLHLKPSITPLYVQSSEQVTNKQILASLSSQFRTLTTFQLQAWIRARIFFPLRNRLGDSFLPSPIALWLRVNFPRVKAGLGVTFTPPSVANSAVFGFTGYTFSTSTATISYQVVAPASTFYLVIYLSRPYSAGRTRLSTSSHRYVGAYLAAASGTINVFNAWRSATKQAPIASGMKVFISMRLLPIASGVLSKPLTEYDIIL